MHQEEDAGHQKNPGIHVEMFMGLIEPEQKKPHAPDLYKNKLPQANKSQAKNQLNPYKSGKYSLASRKDSI